MRDRAHRSLILSAAAISLVALVASWFGTRVIINGILNYEGKQVAGQWALAFAHSLAPKPGSSREERLRPYVGFIQPDKLQPLDNAIFAGEILRYRIYDHTGTIVAASEFRTIGSRSENPAFLQTLADGNTHARIRHSDEPGGVESTSIAIAPLVWGGRLQGAIGIDVDMSARAHQLDRLRNLAMLCLAALLAAVTGIMGASVIRTLKRHERTESELARSEAQYRRLLDNSRAAIVIHDSITVLYANPAAAALHGAGSVEELVGRTPLDLVPVEDRAEMSIRQEKYRITGAVTPIKLSNRRRLDGSIVAADVYTSGIHWNGKDCVQTQSWDISAQVEAQRAVAESEARLSALLANAPFAVSIKDTDYRLIVANRVYAEMAELPFDDLIGRTLGDILDDDRAAELHAQDRRVLETGETIRFESVKTTPKSGTRTLLVDKFPVRTPDGRIIGVAGIMRDVTETREQERRVVENEARLRGFLDYSSSVIFMKDTEHRMTLVNRQCEAFYGYSAGSMIGCRVGDLMDAETAAIAEEQDRKILATGEPVSVEFEITRPDGRSLTILSEKFPVFGPDGSVLEIGGINTDVTALKEKEQESIAARRAAERAEQRFSAFFNHSLSGMYVEDPNLRITLVNRALEQFHADLPGGVLGTTARDLMPKALADEIETIELEILRSGQPMSMEAELRRDNGEIRTLVLEKFPIFSAHGDVIGIGGVNTDITDAKMRSRAIIENEARLSAFLSHAPFMSVFSAPDRTLLKINRQYETFFGIKNEDVVGLKTRPWLPEKFQTLYDGEQSKIITPGTIVERTVEMPNAAGETRLLRQTKFPIVLSDGTVTAVGTIMIDITEQKEYERALEAARDEAEAANRAKTAFLANMSHEIRTPMNGVLGMTDLLSQSSLTRDQHRLLNTVRRSGEALLGVINNVLDVSRIEAREFRLDVTQFDLHELTADTVDIFAEAAAAKRIQLAHHIARDVPVQVMGDDIRLRQVMTNLLGNALKFTSNGEVVIRLSLAGGDSAKPLIRFEVTDTGIGIPREKQAGLFDAFNQGDDSITRKYGGSGLGLSISQHIVALMGGRIDIESNRDCGSTFAFTIELPAVQATGLARHVLPHALAGKRALLVDNSRTNLEILADFAAGWGMESVGAQDAPAARAALQNAMESDRPFDVALIDLTLPEIGGIALARDIRRNEAFDGMRLIALTSFNRDNAEARAAGFSRFTTKPVRRRDLGNLIRETIEQGGDLYDADAGRDRPAPSRRPDVTRGASVLLAEDNPVNREIALRYLEKEGCRTTVAENGVEAVDLFRKSAFDLVLMDVQMPELDGIEATRLIRENEAATGSRRTPVIAATAHAFQEDREKCILAGMDDFLSKPFTRKDLVPLLDRWVGPAGTADAGEASPAGTAASGATRGDALDPAVLRQLERLDSDGGNRVIQKLFALFMDNTPGQLRKLHEALSEGNLGEAAALAHNLKTSAANVAALGLSELFRKAERFARTGNIEGCRKAAAEIDDAYATVCCSLEMVLSPRSDRRESA